MLCQNCEKKEATTHIKQIINGDMSESHLCSDCARLLGVNEFGDFSFSLSDFFGNFFGDMLPAHIPDSTLRCKKCGCSFDDFARTGRLGCAECYETFYDKLLPSLQRIHGKIRHTGKVSVSAGKEKPSEEPAPEAAPAGEPAETVDSLKAQMEEAVKVQDFELAAELRDRIKELEGGNE